VFTNAIDLPTGDLDMRGVSYKHVTQDMDMQPDIFSVTIKYHNTHTSFFVVRKSNTECTI